LLFPISQNPGVNMGGNSPSYSATDSDLGDAPDGSE